VSIVIEPPAAVTNNVNTTVSIPVVARGTSPAYQWYQTNINSGLVTAVSGQTNSSLVFAPATLANSGFYFVVVTNSLSAVTSSVAQLVVVGPPQIVQQSPTDIRVFQGTSPTLQVSAFGPAPISYLWSKNGSPIPGATASSYPPSTATIGTNTYTCSVTNSFGPTAISAITFAVVANPAAPFPQAALADHPVAYWRLNEPDNSLGNGNAGVTAYDYAGGYNASYTNTLLGQSGYSAASDPTETAAEFGDYPPNNDYAGNVPTYLNFGVTNGASGQFSVEAWVLEYLFLNGGNAIVALGYGNGGEQFVLDTGASGGAVRFFVRNAAGVTAVASSTRTIANEPGQPWHHIVGVCDQPNGKIYLYMDGVQLASANITANSGILSSSRPLSIGARESADNARTNLDFQFLGKINDVAVYNYALTSTQVANHYFAAGIAPLITQITPFNLDTNQGATFSFSASATGTAPLNYQWYDNNFTPIPYGTNATLNITNVQPSQSGTYTLTVANLYGSATTNTSLNVNQGPPVLDTLQPAFYMNYSPASFTYTPSLSGSAPFQFQWTRNGTPVPGATSSSYSFTTLPGTNLYAVNVTNAYGFALSTTATNVGVARPTLNPLDYNYKMQISLSGYNRSETLQDFPLLVKLGTNVPGFAYAQVASPTGDDVRFTDATGTNVLSHEIDQWNIGGTSPIWVQVPQFASNSVIWAYWGNPAATMPASQTNGAVWVPQSFEGLPSFDVVYHLKESAFPFLDSSLQYPALTGTLPTPAVGIVGTGELFSGSSLDAGVISTLDDAFTVSAWVNLDPNASNIQSIWANKAGGNSSGFGLFVNSFNTTDQELILETGNGAGNTPTFHTGTGAVSFGVWHLITASINRTNSNAHLYVDGFEVAGTGSVRNDFGTVANHVNLGTLVGGSFPINGLLDESRIRAGNSSSNWVWASYMTVASNNVFQSYAPISSSLVSINAQLINHKLVLTWPSGTLESATQVAGPYTTNNVFGATSPYTNNVTGPQQFFRVKVR